MDPKIHRVDTDQRERIIRTITSFLESEERVGFAFLYGSFTEDWDDSPRPFHDIDVGVYLRNADKKKALTDGLEMSERLSALVRLPVDARVVNFAPVTFLFHVVRGRLLVDKDEDDRCAFMEHVVRHYLDMKPLLHRAIKEAYG